MKTLFKTLVVCCCLLHLSCAQKPLQIVDKMNPWIDDYSSKSKMNQFKEWGTYNVHDPSCLLIGDTYYMYSTDAIYGEDSTAIKSENLPFGYIQVRKSTDLVNWEYVGWAFDEIPTEAKNWVLENSGGVGASNIWAPYIFEYQGKYRLYYSVSAFGKQTSYIGLAESDSPEGPWMLKDCVVKTKTGDPMNAIDPSIVIDQTNGKQWMHYGSYFGGLYCVELNPSTGLALTEGDQGHLTARRFNGKKNNIEAPEIIYNPEFNKYYLFVSYDPLMTTYNVRVGRSDKPEGPFLDYFGKDMREEEDNFPILTYPYQFKNHEGWAGTAHCCAFTDKDGQFYMAHQARLRPDNHMMVLHVRDMHWTPDGWPTVSPERYAATEQRKVTKNDLVGEWEVIEIEGRVPSRDLEAGQILWGQNILKNDEENRSVKLIINEDLTVSGDWTGKYEYTTSNVLKITKGDMQFTVNLFMGHDWENEKQTLLFSGLNAKGHSVWGKRIN